MGADASGASDAADVAQRGERPLPNTSEDWKRTAKTHLRDANYWEDRARKAEAAQRSAGPSREEETPSALDVERARLVGRVEKIRREGDIYRVLVVGPGGDGSVEATADAFERVQRSSPPLSTAREES